MTAYKYLTNDLTSFFNFKWEIGKKYSIVIPGNEMCSNQVFHCYNNPLVAEFIHRLHLNSYTPYELYLIEVDSFCNTDGLKYASKEQTVIRKIDRPVITAEQRIEIAIRLAKTVCDDVEWNEWADKWLSGEDRISQSAYSAANVSLNHSANGGASYAAAAVAYNMIYHSADDDVKYVATYADNVALSADYISDCFDDKEEFNKLLIKIIEEVISK